MIFLQYDLSSQIEERITLEQLYKIKVAFEVSSTYLALKFRDSNSFMYHSVSFLLFLLPFKCCYNQHFSTPGLKVYTFL